MQAARGASLNPSDQAIRTRPLATPHARGGSSPWWPSAYALDIGTKQWAVRPRRTATSTVVGDLLGPAPDAQSRRGVQHRHRVHRRAERPGGRRGRRVLWCSLRLASPLWAVGLGLLLGGVGGNLTDRVIREPGPLRGHVIDWLMLPELAVFNVADMCINGAAGVIILQAFRGIRLDGAREPEQKEGDRSSRA